VGDEDTPRFRRPWEDPEAEPPVVTEPASPGDAESDEDGGDPDLLDLTTGDSDLDGYTDDDYLAATTREYQGLAEEIAAAEGQEYERQAVAASMPGVGSGLVGFEDVTGRPGVREEDVEAEEQQRASDLTVRVGTGVVLVGLFLGCLFLGGVWFTSLVMVVAVLSLGELYATLRTRGFRPIALFGFLGVIGGVVAADLGGAGALASTVIVATAAATMRSTPGRYSDSPRLSGNTVSHPVTRRTGDSSE